MSLHQSKLSKSSEKLFLTYTGMETDLMFTQGVDLPGFASYPLLETPEGRAKLSRYYEDLIQLGRQFDLGVILESATWVANRERGEQIGYAPEILSDRNTQSIELMAKAKENNGDVAIILSANVGPRADAYAPAEQMLAQEAELYHLEQIGVLSKTKTDLISGYTIAYANEAIGIVRAAKCYKLPVMIAFTVETNGCLPTGEPLGKAIEAVDAATDNYASYFMINCAHPDHFQSILSDAPWMSRLKGVVANASRCSHAELDNADTLDDGDPKELGQQLAEIQRHHPQIKILGGCCGTDMRHLTSIAQSITGK